MLAILAYVITAIIAFSSVYLELSFYGYQPFLYILTSVVILNIGFLLSTYFKQEITRRFSQRMLVAQLLTWLIAFSITLFFMAHLKILMLLASIMASTFVFGYLRLRVSIYLVFLIALTYLAVSYIGIRHFEQPGVLSYEVLVLICYIPVCSFVSYMADRVGQQKNLLRTALANLKAVTDERALVMQQLQKAAATDDLTGLLNRRAINIKLEHEYNRLQRYGSSLTIMLADADHFKRINDTYGHHGGDQALKQIAEVLKNAIRKTDFAARWGGEEFLIVLPDTNLEEGKIIANRILSDIGAQQINYQENTLSLTLSAGITQVIPEQPVENALKKVDDYLYEAKGRGRNCIVDDNSDAH